MRRLVAGYALAEAPCPDGNGAVYFSDVAGGGVYKIDPGGQIECVIPDRRRVGGIVLHASGGIVLTGRSVVHASAGTMRELLALDGVVFNDLCCDDAGRIWVGGIRFDRAPAGDFGGAVYRIDVDGDVAEMSSGFGIPNGMAFSPDGTVLYVVDSATRTIESLSLDKRGEIAGRRIIVDLSQRQGPDFSYPPALPTPDGLAVDEQGGVWVAIAGGNCVQRFAPDGSSDVRIHVPADRPTSVAFGGGAIVWISTSPPPRRVLHRAIVEECSRRGALSLDTRLRPHACRHGTTLTRKPNRHLSLFNMGMDARIATQHTCAPSRISSQIRHTRR